MTETKKRINALKKRLPGIKARVAATALSLLLAVAMLTSVSFAWVTMSRAPELGGVHTVVSANGNLEVALSDFDGLAPDRSGISDSFGAAGQTVHGANTSWGNLINLAGNYGLENLVLRPARLDPGSSAYLSSVVYGEDGRVEGTTTDFGFTTWREVDSATKEHRFVVLNENFFGVRAISSVAYPDGKGELLERLDKIKNRNRSTADDYLEILSKQENISVIQSVVQIYLDHTIQTMIKNHDKLSAFADTKKINPDCGAYLESLDKMIDEVYADVVLPYGQVLVDIANLQQSFKSQTYTPYTLETLLAADATELKANNVNLANTLSTYKNELKMKTESAQGMMETLITNRKEGAVVRWEDIEDPVNILIDIKSVRVEGKTADQISKMGATGAMSFVNGLPDQLSVQIWSGALYVYEDLSGTRMANILNEGQDKGGMMVTVRIVAKALGFGVDRTFDGFVTTKLALTTPSRLSKDLDVTNTMGQSQSGSKQMIAQDTYGMVLDLWFRTNAGNQTKGETVLLTLNGLPKIEYKEEPMQMVLDGESEPRTVYVYKCFQGKVEDGKPVLEELLVYKDTRQDANGNEATYYFDCSTREIVYVVTAEQKELKDENGNTVIDKETGKPAIYFDRNVTETPIDDSHVSPKMRIVETVVGYESANRVWQNDQLDLTAEEMSATQGSGSCYTFYADTPEESARALDLLSHMKFAFLDAEGNLLAEAKLDVEHVFQSSGKHIVPIVIPESDHYVLDNMGNKVYGITRLTKNVPARISMVVYLDGTELENEMVLAKGDIQGSLNLQFDAGAELRSVDDMDLAIKTQSVTASINKKNFTYGKNEDPAILSANVEGLNANSVQAVFQRKVNATQGSRMDPITLSPADANKIRWTAQCAFTYPGTYVLNELIVDGVIYQLQSDPIVVEVSGFNLQSISMTGNHSAFTTEPSVSRPLSVKFAADMALQPKAVTARFMKPDGNAISVPLTQEGDLWKGDAVFPASGTYTLEFLVLVREELNENNEKVDKEYYFEIPKNQQITFVAYLGLNTSVELIREDGLDFVWKPSDGIQEIKIKTQIYTDTDVQLKGLDEVVLYYLPEGSSNETDGFSAPLTWKNGAYEGSFQVSGKYGSFRFAYLKIGNDRIRTAVYADEFFVKSPDPPKFVEHKNPNTVIVLDDNAGAATDAYYYAVIENAQGYTVRAVFTNPDGTLVRYVTGSVKDAATNLYQFALPTVDGKKNGQWKIQEIRVYGLGEAMDAEDTDAAFKDRNFMRLDPKDSATYTVIHEFVIEVDNMNVGNRTDTQFMSQQSLVGLKNQAGEALGVTIKLDGGIDWPEGLTISDAKIIYTHTGGNKVNGGYDFTGVVDHPDKNQTVGLTLSSGDFANGKWVISEGKATLAGLYNCVVTFKLSGTNVGETIFGESVTHKDKLTVQSANPTVKISGVSTNASTDRYYLSSTPTSLNVITGSYNKKINDFNAVVYMYVQAQNGNLDQEQVKIKYPTVSFSLSGIPATHSGVTMTFQGSTPIQFAAGSSSANGPIGKGTDGVFDEGFVGIGANVEKWPVFNPAGKQTVQTIAVTYGGVEYTVTLTDAVTINNPQYPPYLDYAINDATCPSELPARVYSTDGSTVTLTLPTLGAWSHETSSSKDGTYAATGKTETASVYTTAKGTIRYTHTQYTRTMTEYQAVSSTTTWVVTKEITGWKIGDTVYKPGETVTVPVTGAQKITAVISTIDGPKTTKSTTATKYYVTFAETGSTKTNFSSTYSKYGTQVTSVSAYWTEPTYN